MNKAQRLQSIFNIANDLYKNNLPITLDAIFKKLDSKVTKVTISDDLKYMRSFIKPIGKHWVFTQEGIEAAKKDDIFQFTSLR